MRPKSGIGDRLPDEAYIRQQSPIHDLNQREASPHLDVGDQTTCIERLSRSSHVLLEVAAHDVLGLAPTIVSERGDGIIKRTHPDHHLIVELQIRHPLIIAYK